METGNVGLAVANTPRQTKKKRRTAIPLEVGLALVKKKA